MSILFDHRTDLVQIKWFLEAGDLAVSMLVLSQNTPFYLVMSTTGSFVIVHMGSTPVLLPYFFAY